MYVAKKKNFTELKKVFTMAIRILKKASKCDVIKVKSVVLLIFLKTGDIEKIISNFGSGCHENKISKNLLINNIFNFLRNFSVSA